MISERSRFPNGRKWISERWGGDFVRQYETGRIKRAWVLVALASGSAAAQEPEGKTWLDMTCAVQLQSAPDGPFVVSKVDGSYRNACTIADWPVSSPTATLECEDGSRPTMELQGDDVLLDGLPVGTGQSDEPNRVLLLPKGDQRLNCDASQEGGTAP